MIPKEITPLLAHHRDDSGDEFRLKEAKNHPFLSKIKLQFTGEGNGKPAVTTVGWIVPPNSQTITFRLRNCYDATG